jgi:beta-glucosidase
MKALVGAVMVVASAQGAAPPQLGKDPVSAVVAAMTTEEKVRLLVGMGMDLVIPGLPPLDPEDTKIPWSVPGAAGRTHAIPRLGIPSLTLADGPAGVRIKPKRESDPSRTFHATGFPVATLLASSWDTDLLAAVGAAFGEEARDYGVDVLLAPGMNVHRNPLGGRNFEYYSEDPLVAGRMAAAFVKGVQSAGVGTSIKHFAANNQEFNRMQSDTRVSERALREIYLRGFEIAVREGRPWTVMSSYNLVNGTYTSQSRDLLTTVLRDEWGFAGLVMTDWFAGNDVVAQVAAGNDMIMPGNPAQTRALVEAAGTGALRAADLDRSVARALELVQRSLASKGTAPSNRPDLKAHAAVARRAAAEGMVLLANAGQALPLPPGRKVALFGNAGYELSAGGTGSGDVHKAYVVSIAEGLAAAGHAIDSALQDAYTRHLADEKVRRPKPAMPFLPPPPLAEMAVGPERLAPASAAADVAVVVLGRSSGEFKDREVEGDFELAPVEQALLKDVSAAFHAAGKKMVVVLNVGGVVEVASWRGLADAILVAWQPGQEGGHAVADVLSGRVNPSGKLATTFPMRYADVPSAKSFPGRELEAAPPLIQNPFAGKPAEVTYDEGIFVGYRYYGTFGVEPAFPFGHGLSYTRFGYGPLRLASPRLQGGEATASLTVTNRGTVAGREAVQLYVSAPAGPPGKPVRELRAFAKTKLLAPGEAETVTFTLRARDLASFDAVRSVWSAAPGRYTLSAGASSADLRQSATLDVGEDLLVESAHPVLRPKVRVPELVAPPKD